MAIRLIEKCGHTSTKSGKTSPLAVPIQNVFHTALPMELE
jgi:ubiquitin C-terminal hydrolase